MAETNRIEYKRELNSELDIEKEVIAFLNYKEGGFIYIGIDKDGSVVGVNDVDDCMLVSERVNELYKEICCEELINVKKIIIKECLNGLILYVDGKIDIDRIKEKCLAVYINNMCVYKVDDGYINISYFLFICSWL